MPNAEQRRQMTRFAGCARYVYNKALGLKKELYEKKEKASRFQLDKMLVQWKQETPWLSEAPAHSLQQAILDLDRAYQNFFKKRPLSRSFTKKDCEIRSVSLIRSASSLTKQIAVSS